MLDEALAEGVRDERVQADLVAVRDAYRSAEERVRAARERIAATGTGESLPPEEAGPAHLELARHLHEAGDRAGALHHCEEAMGALGRAPDLLFECGYYALLHRQYGRAAGMLEETVAASPADDRALVDLGIAYLRLGRLTSASEAFRRAREANPQSVPAVLYHGNALYRLRRLADAEAAYREVIRLGAPAELAQQVERLLIQIEEDLLPPREPVPAASGAQR
jgi:tetratricopeptide (TPR) repeat protein